MINFFRRIRQRLFTENKFSKYILYAAGEILLVVFGILIALQINNKNEERIQAKELDGLMKSISSAIESDIKYLQLIRTARANIGVRVDSIFNTYITSKKTTMAFIDYAYIGNTYNNLTNVIYYQPNLGAFQSLKNSIYLSKLQGTDIELLLNTFYTSADRLKKLEEENNQLIKNDYQVLTTKLGNKSFGLLLSPWDYLEEGDVQERFLAILNDDNSKALLSNGFREGNSTSLYDQQILLGEKYIEMIDKGEMEFDEQTKIDFSGTFYSYSEVDILNLLIKGKVPAGFGLLYAQSGNDYYEGERFENDYRVLIYPENTFDWGSPYFTIEALNGRVTEMDFSKYEKVVLEMKGENGGEKFALMMKDKYDLHDGTESRVNITVTNTWETYEVPIAQFETADKKIIETPLGFVFIGSEGVTIYVRSVQFN